jgi:hypothetical protein
MKILQRRRRTGAATVMLGELYGWSSGINTSFGLKGRFRQPGPKAWESDTSARTPPEWPF